jgi:hypothetical protein
MKFFAAFTIFLVALVAAQAAPADDTHFLLWTRKNPTVQYELITGNTANLGASNYDRTKPTKILAHGWQQNGYSSDTVIEMRKAMLDHEDCNFISVDWENLASNLNYFASAPNVVPVGQLTAGLINFLIAQGTSRNNLHLIGFSLGAHVVGNAGMGVTGGKLPRITGLDPAYPDFSVQETGNRLDTTDATFVDIIHTNSAGSIAQGGLSFPVPIGHVDFWPNGGEAQPGCAAPGPDIIDLATGCSHGRAWIYFTESINSRTLFTSTKCDSYTNWQNGGCRLGATASMGFPVSTSASGSYYLDTKSTAPFALGFLKNQPMHPRDIAIN